MYIEQATSFVTVPSQSIVDWSLVVAMAQGPRMPCKHLSCVTYHPLTAMLFFSGGLVMNLQIPYTDALNLWMAFHEPKTLSWKLAKLLGRWAQ